MLTKDLGFFGVIGQYADKINVMYSSGSAGMLDRGFTIYPSYSKMMNELVSSRDSNNGLLAKFTSQIIYVFTLLFTFVLICKMFIRNEICGIRDLFSIMFIGIFLFHILVWEVEPRYLYLVVPLLFSVGSSSFGELELQEKYIFSKNTKLGISILTFVLLGLFLIDNKYLMNENSYSDISVQQQNFFRTKEIKLKPGQKIVQKFHLNVAPQLLRLNAGKDQAVLNVKVINLKNGRNMIRKHENSKYTLRPDGTEVGVQVFNKSKTNKSLVVNTTGLKSNVNIYGVQPISKSNERGSEFYLNEGFFRNSRSILSKSTYLFVSLILVLVISIALFVLLAT